MRATHPEIRFLLKLLTPYRGALVGATALLLADSVITLAMPWFAGHVAQALLNNQVPEMLLLVWLGAMAVQALVAFGNGVVMGSTGARVGADLGSRVYDHLQALA